MRNFNLNLKCKIDSAPLEAFLFFVQSLEEQLYDYTDDSYKAPALNTFTRTLELQGLAELNHLTGRGQDALNPYVEELEWSVRRDPALSSQTRAICQVQVKSIKDSLAQPDRVARGLAGIRIALGDYFQLVKSSILEHIENQPNKKEEISQLAANFVIQAEVNGLPRRHTYYTLQKLIITKLKKLSAIDHRSLLKDFFDEFKLENTSYSAIFIANRGIKSFPKLLAAFRMEALDAVSNLPALRPQQIEFLESRTDAQVFIRFNEIKANNPAAVHEIGANIFTDFMSAIRYIEHKFEYHLSGLSLIIRNSDKKCFMVRNSPDPMHCWNSSHDEGEAGMLRIEEALHGRHLLPESAYRLRRAVGYHGVALRSGTPENQLVDLWAALEGLLSQPPLGGRRIDFFAESLIPPLTLMYPEKILRSLHSKVQLHPKLNDDLEKVIPTGTNSFAKFVHLLLCKEYEEERKPFFDQLVNAPLLKNRAYKVALSLNTKASTLETLKNHRKKLRWHIDRIYSTRNSIMHNASAMPYLPTLVENLHVYNDALVDTIVKVSISAHEYVSIESVLQYVASWEKFRLRELAECSKSDAKLQVTASDVWDTVFGSDLVLTPVQ